MQRNTNIGRETSASLSVISIASFISMCSLLLQLHLTRPDPVVPLFVMLGNASERVQSWVGKGGAGVAREL